MPEPTKYNSKVVYGGKTLIDLTADTVTPDQILSGGTAHDKSGAPITGTCDFDVNSTDATAAADDVLEGKTAYARGAKVTGRMKNNGSVTKNITTKDEKVSIPIGFHDGSGKIGIDPSEAAKIVPSNILKGVTVLGVLGTSEPSSDVTVQAKTVTPKTTQQVITPDPEIDYLSQVTVEAIPYTESENAAGGMTVTIAG